MSPARSQNGAALLLAMLTVTLVATLAATALWQQWRGVEIEAAERNRTQMAWILNGALDWARLILQEDARSSQVDHLSEPWALPLEEARLSSFLAFDKNNTDDSREAFLSGQIVDLQSRMNVLNLVDNGKPSEPALRSFRRLFELLQLPESELGALADKLLQSTQPGTEQSLAPLRAQRVQQLIWLGLSPDTLKRLEPYITLLPTRTSVNLNTARAEIIHACVTGLDLAQAQRLVTGRALAHFPTVAEALRLSGVDASKVDTTQIGVSSQYFEIRGRLRMDRLIVQEHSLVERQSNGVTVLWREREVVSAFTTGTTLIQ